MENGVSQSGYEYIYIAQKLRKEYREALLGVGRSPDTHLSEFFKEEDHYFLEGYEKEKAFLARLTSFYKTLADEESRLLFHDIFYQTHHYVYWYVAHMSESEHRRRFKSLTYMVEGYLHAA